MQVTIYAKKRTTAEGKAFCNYLTTLTKKDGTELKCSVKFREECGQPKAEKCPMNIAFEKADANLATKTYTDDNGEVLTAYVLWLSNWAEGEKFVDHSMDDFI